MEKATIQKLFPELKPEQVELANLNVEQFLKVVVDFMAERKSQSMTTSNDSGLRINKNRDNV